MPRKAPRRPKAAPTATRRSARAVPPRTCVGCRRRAGIDELVRIVRLPDGSLRIGRTLPGRGAWLCAGSLECLNQAAQRNAFSRALRSPVSSDDVLALGPELAG